MRAKDVMTRNAVAVALLAAAAAAHAGDAMRMQQTVQGYRFELAVETDYDEALGDPKHARGFRHRIAVTVREAKFGRPVSVASASLDVAERGLRGEVYPLRLAGRGDAAFAYEARVPMARGKPYRILVHGAPAGAEAVLEAQFEYRHHH